MSVSKKQLYVRMLGGYELEYEGNNLIIEKNATTKVNKLFQMLACEPAGVPRGTLIQNLFYDDEGDTSNSFRALVFRLRKRLGELGIDGKEFVIIEKGVYKLDTSFIEIHTDIQEFENLYKDALYSSMTRKIQELEKACNIYRGEFLPAISTVPWAITYSVKYKNMYLDATEILCKYYREHNEYQKLYKLSHITSQIYPFNESQVYEMEALIGLNKKNEAVKLYEDTERMLFEELGVSMPDRMVELLNEVGKLIKHNADVISNVKKNLETFKEEEEGALFYNYPSFVDSYRLMKRVIKRSKQSAYLMLITITDGKGYALDESARLTELSQELNEAISRSIRSGDIYTRYSDGQYLIFLLGINQEDCSLVRDRIFSNMSSPSRKKYLQCHITPVNSDMDTEREIAATMAHGAKRRR